MKPKCLFILGVLLITLFIILVNLLLKTEQEKEIRRKKPMEYDVTIQVIEGEGDSGQDKEIEKVAYEKDGIKASYPQFILGSNTSYNENARVWNKLILNDFNKILQIYSFRPFPEETPAPSAIIPTLLTISYRIKANDNKKASILYTADYNSSYSAHPSSLVYTTNIDKVNNKRVRLTDYVTVNKDFVKDFRSWTLNTEITDPELLQAIQDYITSMTDEDLLLGFQAADQIGSDNPWGIYSYTTPDSLGISIQAPNYIGDHIEFERPLSELENFRKDADKD
jgi:hypothetical protein